MVKKYKIVYKNGTQKCLPTITKKGLRKINYFISRKQSYTLNVNCIRWQNERLVEMNLEEYLYGRILADIKKWDEKNIYAISFFVHSEESNEYNGYKNFPEFSIGYNTEEDCNHASQLSEERWNFAFWRQDMISIISPKCGDEGAKVLFEWYKENHIENIGVEDEGSMYDEDMNYIGKGPVGYYELLCAVSNVAKKLQTDGSIATQFGNIPVIVHDLEYPWYIAEATKNANPNGEADVFLKALKEEFPE